MSNETHTVLHYISVCVHGLGLCNSVAVLTLFGIDVMYIMIGRGVI